MKKGQSAIEFTVLMGMMFLIFTVFFFAVSTKLLDIQKENEASLLEDLGNYVQNELRLAVIAEDGYFRQFQLPATIGGYDYSINITTYIDMNHTDVIFSYINYTEQMQYVLPVGNITGSIDKAKNTTVTVKKQNNVVIVST